MGGASNAVDGGAEEILYNRDGCTHKTRQHKYLLGKMKLLHGLFLIVNPALAFHHGSSGAFRAGKSTAMRASPQPHVIIVGKIIVDEYGNPDEESSPAVTVGGGGPQAAMGAALALAANSYLKDGGRSASQPPPQPVTMVGPVGDDFSTSEDEALLSILGPALQTSPRYFRGKGLVTPRIRLWHDEQQVLQWYALNDSFGESGAAGLWGSHPTVDDYMGIIEDYPDKPILQVIVEGGAEAPGGNGDSKPLLDSSIRSAISFLGVEPILFPNDEGRVSEKDASHCSKLLQAILDATPRENPASVVISPDMAAYQGIKDVSQPSSFALDSWPVRDGPKGSHIHQQSPASAIHIPAATLKELVNPTGAGNAYSAAFTSLRGSGCDAIGSASIATGVGAVFCEYAHCPPYDWDTIERVVKASEEAKAQVSKEVLEDGVVSGGRK